jgi:hypothetical protein
MVAFQAKGAGTPPLPFASVLVILPVGIRPFNKWGTSCAARITATETRAPRMKRFAARLRTERGRPRPLCAERNRRRLFRGGIRCSGIVMFKNGLRGGPDRMSDWVVLGTLTLCIARCASRATSNSPPTVPIFGSPAVLFTPASPSKGIHGCLPGKGGGDAPFPLIVSRNVTLHRRPRHGSG